MDRRQMLVGSLATVAAAKMSPMPVEALDLIGPGIGWPSAYLVYAQMPRLKNGEVQTATATFKWNGPGGPEFKEVVNDGC